MKNLKTASAVCLVEKTYQDLYSVKVGDTVNIDGTVFEIVGVIKRNADAGGIFLPYRTLQDDVSKAQYLQRYTIAAELTDHIFMSQIDYGQLGLSGVAKTARDYYRGKHSVFLQPKCDGNCCVPDSIYLCTFRTSLISCIAKWTESVKLSEYGLH